jgi:hypothetical protein
MDDLREAIAAQKRKCIEVPTRKLSLTEAGVLQAGKREGPIALSGLLALFRTLNLPGEFAQTVCPDDLLITIVNRLAQCRNDLVLVRLVDGVVTGVMPATRQPIGHDTLIDWLGNTRPIREATLAGEQLRIIGIDISSRDLLPNDPFDFGWELVSGEGGWNGTILQRLTIRQICSNGMIGLGYVPIFKRTFNSHRPATQSLVDLQLAIDKLDEPRDFGPAVRWALEQRLGREFNVVTGYLSQQLEGRSTLAALGEISADSSWYDLLNSVTALAKLHLLAIRRRYEAAGGMLLNWFLGQGRSRPPWRRVSCTGCENWSIGRDAEEAAEDRAEQDDEQAVLGVWDSSAGEQRMIPPDVQASV